MSTKINPSKANIVRKNAAAIVQQNRAAISPQSAIIPLYTMFRPTTKGNPAPPGRWLTNK
jgi:hypothetical protein